MALTSWKTAAIRSFAKKNISAKNSARISSGISAIAGLSILGLTACSSFEPEYVACPDVKALAGAENVILTGTKSGQKVTARFDGVSPKCVATPDGYQMDLGFALIIRRDLSVHAKVEEVPIDLTIAYIDKNDEVVDRSVESFTGFLPTSMSGSRPVFNVRDDVPAGTRVVLALGRKAN